MLPEIVQTFYQPCNTITWAKETGFLNHYQVKLVIGLNSKSICNLGTSFNLPNTEILHHEAIKEAFHPVKEAPCHRVA